MQYGPGYLSAVLPLIQRSNVCLLAVPLNQRSAKHAETAAESADMQGMVNTKNITHDANRREFTFEPETHPTSHFGREP